MKYLIVCLSVIVYGLSVSPALAQQACLVNVTCPDGSGVQQCNGIWSGEECNIPNYKTDCLPCSLNPPPRNESEPSTPEPPTNNQPSSPQNPPSVSAPEVTIPEATDEGLISDEIALLKLSKTTLPESYFTSIEPKQRNLWESIDAIQKAPTLIEKLEVLGGIFTSVFGFKPNNFGMFASRAEIERQVHLPEQLQPDPSQNIVQQTGDNLGKSVGVYSINIPRVLKTNPDTTQKFECLYEKSVYPEGINPITNGESCN